MYSDTALDSARSPAIAQLPAIRIFESLIGAYDGSAALRLWDGTLRRGGMECGMGHGHPHGNDGHARQDRESNSPRTGPDRRPKESISGKIVDPETALNSMYQGHMYHFASRENRDAFEASPAQYASRAGEREECARYQREVGSDDD